MLLLTFPRVRLLPLILAVAAQKLQVVWRTFVLVLSFILILVALLAHFWVVVAVNDLINGLPSRFKDRQLGLVGNDDLVVFAADVRLCLQFALELLADLSTYL